MAHKGPQQDRRPEQAAPNRQEEQRHQQPDATNAALHDAAMQAGEPALEPLPHNRWARAISNHGATTS